MGSVTNGLGRKMIETWIRRKEEVQRIEAECKARVGPLKQELKRIEAALLKLMNQEGIRAIKSDAGTAYLSEVKTVAVEDWQTVVDHIMETGRLELLERRISKSVALELGDVPGLKIETIRKVNVRRV